MPPRQTYRPDPRFAALGPDFADPAAPARFPERILRFRNQGWAARVGLDALDASEWEAAFAHFDPLPDNMPAPLAMRYHGHQFRVYNPDIGDGRGFLFAQLRDDKGRLLDLATKGSGQTPYSRFGDGRLTLKGGVREVLAAEMLEALGVKTSKAFSLFETGEALQRNDEPSPTRSSVLVRLSHSHVRFGTFQRLVYHERPDLIRVLIDHVVENYYPEIADLEDAARVPALFDAIVNATARLAASWMAAGFVHGVLNTDNMVVTGESFDYGPWRFLPRSEPGFTAAYFDEMGLYAFGRQPEAASWNLAQLGGCFSLVSETTPLEDALKAYGAAYLDALRTSMFARLGLTPGGRGRDLDFLQSLFGWMTEAGAGWAQFFFDWRCGAASTARALESPQAPLYATAGFAPLRAALEAYAPLRPELLSDPLFQRPTPPDMLIDEVEAIWDAIAVRDDWGPFEQKITEVRAWGAALRG
ncbi:MAG: YdiU family protein [Alphaproteobacteria bacterium]|nr:YdiU family protein [Alphaproteobacteria bacterium]